MLLLDILVGLVGCVAVCAFFVCVGLWLKNRPVINHLMMDDQRNRLVKANKDLREAQATLRRIEYKARDLEDIDRPLTQLILIETEKYQQYLNDQLKSPGDK